MSSVIRRVRYVRCYRLYCGWNFPRSGQARIIDSKKVSSLPRGS